VKEGKNEQTISEEMQNESKFILTITVFLDAMSQLVLSFGVAIPVLCLLH